MSSVGTFLFDKQRAVTDNTKTVGVDYTVKVGTSDNYFEVDAVINVEDPADDCTITIPDGLYAGQMLIINLTSNDDSKTVTIDGNAAQDSTIATAGMYQISMWTNDTTGWIILSESVTS